MFRRLFVGLVEGLIVGLAMAFACVRGLGISAPGALILALLGALAGFVVGLVAGRPVWARDAKTEALLKAGVGGLFGAGLAFALGRWLSLPVNLSAFSFGTGPAGQLAAITLPAVACALALFFELDNTDSSANKPGIAGSPPKQRLGATQDAEPDDLNDLEELDDVARRKREKR